MYFLKLNDKWNLHGRRNIKSDVGRVLSNEYDPRHNELLLEISKRFSKYAKDQQSFDTDTGEVQDFQHIISLIVACCDENGWLGN